VWIVVFIALVFLAAFSIRKLVRSWRSWNQSWGEGSRR
jgi:hypothetical protein